MRNRRRLSHPPCLQAAVCASVGPWKFSIGWFLGILLVSGCRELNPGYVNGPADAISQGIITRDVLHEQERRADAAKFIIPAHEFKLRSTELNVAGQDHVKQIAVAIQHGVEFPVVVERSMDDNSAGKFQYPVQPSPELDNSRRDLIVAALEHLGVDDAENRVVIAPSFAQSATGIEAETAYQRGLLGGRGGSGFGGGFGGFAGYGGGGGGMFGGGMSDDSAPATGTVAGSLPD
jgi:hypothetical protein